MLNQLASVHIKGFRSLADVKIDNLPQVAVLIGTNGAGKSNFIRFFEMMSWMMQGQSLAEFVQRQGGADDQLFGGSKNTPSMEAELILKTEQGSNDYQFTLSHAHPDRFIFTKEGFRFTREGFFTKAPWNHLKKISWNHLKKMPWKVPWKTPWNYLGSAHEEARIVTSEHKTAQVIVHLLRNCAVYQFHDTSDSSNFKTTWDKEENRFLRAHGGNLAAVLFCLERENPQRFQMICRHISRGLPAFDRFQIEEKHGRVRLRWKAKGMEKTYGAHLTSDGSLRFFALVTLLNLPAEMLPEVIFLDEPELGLHPTALALVANMIKSLANERQVIVATQSPLLVDEFGLDEIIVLELRDGRTEARRLDEDEYRHWLDEYTTGELWQKNLLGGQP